LIYRLANSLSSGGRSTRSGGYGDSSVHNDEEELKSIGTIAFVHAVDGGEMQTREGSRKTGFDPDGPGSFNTFIYRTVEGAMKNAHTYEKRHFGMEKTSLDAPRGDDEETDLYNQRIGAGEIDASDLIGSFEDEDEREMLYDCIDDVVQNDREKEMLFSRFGLNGQKELSVTEIAEKYGVSKQRVSTVIDKLVKRLKNYFSHEMDEGADGSSLDGMTFSDAKHWINELWYATKSVEELIKSLKKAKITYSTDWTEDSDRGAWTFIADFSDNENRPRRLTGDLILHNDQIIGTFY